MTFERGRMDALTRLVATICLTLHVLVAAAGPVIDARIHRVGADSEAAVAESSGRDGGTLLHAELCGLCRTLQHIDAPPATALEDDASGTPTTSSLPERTDARATALRASSLGARAPPV